MLTESIPRHLRKLFPPLNHFLIQADDTERMSISMRHPAPACFHPARPTVEDLIGRIADLVLERQSLRANGAERETLERNRADLVSAHWDLSRALIERHCPPKADSEAAAA
jgi:hypothetical protein